MKAAAWILGLVIIAALGYAYFSWQVSGEVETPETADESLVSENTTGEILWSWDLAEAGTDPETGAPMTKVVLDTNGGPYDLGTHLGSCFIIEESAWELLENEQSGVICWWAGGGREMGIFSEEDGSWVVKIGEVEEGAAEEPGFRGNFENKVSVWEP